MQDQVQSSSPSPALSSGEVGHKAPVPTIGRIVHYRVTEDQAKTINKRRADALRNMTMHRKHSTGAQVHVGNQVEAGNVYPMMIVAVHGPTPTSSVNGQVSLDGNDLFWVTSVSVGEGPGKFSWPTRA